MAALRELIRRNKGEILDGIAQVIVWKEGRSWNLEAFWAEDGDYENGFLFSNEDVQRMKEISEADHKAISFNGYYNGFGCEDAETAEDRYYNSAEAIQERVEWFYHDRLNQLSAFIEGWVVPNETEEANNEKEDTTMANKYVNMKLKDEDRGVFCKLVAHLCFNDWEGRDIVKSDYGITDVYEYENILLAEDREYDYSLLESVGESIEADDGQEIMDLAEANALDIEEIEMVFAYFGREPYLEPEEGEDEEPVEEDPRFEVLEQSTGFCVCTMINGVWFKSDASFGTAAEAETFIKEYLEEDI